MKKLFFATFVAAVLFGFCALASAEVSECVLGGPTAMNPNRQLAKGETFVFTDRPLVVNLQFKPTKRHPEQVGECMLPSGATVAQKDGILQWVKVCGNDEVNKNIVVGPVPKAKDGTPGIKGDPGPKGDPGKNCSVKENNDGTKTITCAETQVVVENGEKGDPGSSCTVRDNGNGTKSIICEDRTSVLVSDGKTGPPGPQGAPAPESKWSNWWLVPIAAAIIGVGYLICKNNCGGDVITYITTPAKGGVGVVTH